jgi:Lipase (class 3)
MTEIVPACSTCGLAVEWGRSCYVSGWRLFRDNLEVVTRGRYYFAPPNTPHFSGFHNLGSRNWEDKNHLLEQGLGEDQTYKQSWNGGQIPAAPPLPSVVGSLECIQQGETIEHSIVASSLIDGFPPDCFGPEERLPVWREISAYARCVMQRFWATVICHCYNDDLPAIQNIVTDLIGNIATITLHKGNSLYPTVVTIVTPEWSAIAMAGTSNFQQAALQGLYSLAGPVNFGVFSTLPLWYDNATRGIQFLEDDGYVVGTPLFVCGHSYGAASALIIAARIRAAHTTAFIRFLALGCPKIGDERLQALVSQCAGYSIDNVGDIVTFVPFDYLQIWAFLSVFNPLQLLALTTWASAPHRFLQHEDGRLVPRENDTITSGDIGAVLTAAFNAIALAPILPHRLSEYEARMKIRCNAVSWPINADVLADYALCSQNNTTCATAIEFSLGTTIVLDNTVGFAHWWKVAVPNGTHLHCLVTCPSGVAFNGNLFQGPDCLSLTGVHLYILFENSGCAERTTATDTFWYMRVNSADAGAQFVVDVGVC